MVSGNTATRTRFVYYYRSLNGLRPDPTDDQNHQAQPISCAAAIAVQKVIAAENLIENGRQTGEYLAQLLRERLLLSPNALARPFTSDIRGGGSFWVVEFHFTGPEGEGVDLKGQRFARLVQARCFEKGLLVSASRSGGDAQGVEAEE
jgi:E3 ubiquitin-protein ligase TRIP12